MSTSVTGAAAPSGATGTPSTSTPKSNSAVDKGAFLQMLVAQIKNQDPLNPADGTQFLTQLAQFSELEQMMDVRNELVSIREQLTTWQQSQQTEQPSGAAKDNV